MSGYVMFKKTMLRIIWETRSNRKLYAEWYMYSGFFLHPLSSAINPILKTLIKT